MFRPPKEFMDRLYRQSYPIGTHLDYNGVLVQVIGRWYRRKEGSVYYDVRELMHDGEGKVHKKVRDWFLKRLPPSHPLTGKHRHPPPRWSE